MIPVSGGYLSYWRTTNWSLSVSSRKTWNTIFHFICALVAWWICKKTSTFQRGRSGCAIMWTKYCLWNLSKNILLHFSSLSSLCFRSIDFFVLLSVQKLVLSTIWNFIMVFQWFLLLRYKYHANLVCVYFYAVPSGGNYFDIWRVELWPNWNYPISFRQLGSLLPRA